jgi:transcriptional regulator with XRE-family HTH domain
MPVKTKDEITFMVGQRIREARTAKNLTIGELAHESGMEYSQLSRIERGKINTGVYQVYVLATVLDISLESLFEGLS